MQGPKLVNELRLELRSSPSKSCRMRNYTLYSIITYLHSER